MADLVPGLLICLMAVQTIQHDGKLLFCYVLFLTLSSFVTGSGLFSQIKVTKHRINYSSTAVN